MNPGCRFAHPGYAAGFEALGYDQRFGYYRLPLQKDDVVKKREQLKQLIEAAYKNKTAH
jgi:hypothetical protein